MCQNYYLLRKHRFRNSVKKVKTFLGTNVNLDHNMLCTGIHVKFEKIRGLEKK